MEHDKHIHEFEQDLHETVKRVSVAYKKAQPDKKLLENVLARLPELETAVTTEKVIGAPSPYQRFFPLKELAYLAPAALVVVLVAAMSLSGTINDPTRLAQETPAPEAAPMVMMVEDAQPSLMMASEPAPEGDAVNARMMAPSAKMAPAMLGEGSMSSSEEFIDRVASEPRSLWTREEWSGLSFYLPPRYFSAAEGDSLRVRYGDELGLEPGSAYPLTLDIRKFDRGGYAPSPIVGVIDGSFLTPKIGMLSCVGASFTQESFEDGGAEMEQKHIRRYTLVSGASIYELVFTYSTCGYCSMDSIGEAAQNEFSRKNEFIMCEILKTFSVLQ